MRAAAVTWQSPISPEMFLQTGLGRASTRQLSQPLSGEIGDRRVTAAARIVPQPFLGISVSVFPKFKCTTHKNFREFVVSHTLLECLANATLSTIEQGNALILNANLLCKGRFFHICLAARLQSVYTVFRSDPLDPRTPPLLHV